MMQAIDSPSPSVVGTPAKPERGAHLWDRWQILAFGQGLSFLLALMWASQSTLYLHCEWNSPAFSSSWAYLLLSLHLVPLIIKGREMRQNKGSSVAPNVWFLHIIPLQGSPWIYFGATFLSFYGIYLNLLSIRYTAITSTSLFDAVSIPTTILLSKFFLGRRYRQHHILGALLCLTGVILNVGYDFATDHHIFEAVTDTSIDAADSVQMKTVISNITGSEGDYEDGSKEYPNKVVGDLMACMGGILFGANDVVAEFSVRRFGGTTEYLGMIGFFGTLLSGIQAVISERDTVAAFFQGNTAGGCSSTITTWLLIAYVIGQFSRKAGLALFLTVSDAALLQLSLLTSDLYTLMFSVIYLHILPLPLQWVAMVCVIVGIVVYEVGPKSTLEQQLPPPELHRSTNHVVAADRGSSKMV